jgi:hypothetical protein
MNIGTFNYRNNDKSRVFEEVILSIQLNNRE